MIIKEPLFLSNCDSVRAMARDELRKRVLVGAAVANGIVVSPNLLIDNADIADTLGQPRLNRWFRGEGSGALLVRGMFEGNRICLEDYFDALPGRHVFSRFAGRRKDDLTYAQRDRLLRDLDRLDKMLEAYAARFRPIPRDRTALSREITNRLDREPDAKALLNEAGGLPAEGTLVSRSQWYDHLEATLPDKVQRDRVRMSVIDTSFNALFVTKGEAFAMDRMPVLDGLPEAILDATVEIRNYRKQIDHILTAVRVLSFLYTAGTDGIATALSDEALGVLEDKAEDLGMKWFDRRNWFGLYPRLTSTIGVEIVASNEYENRWFRVDREDQWYWIERSPGTTGAAILPVSATGVILQRHSRASRGWSETIELPRVPLQSRGGRGHLRATRTRRGNRARRVRRAPAPAGLHASRCGSAVLPCRTLLGRLQRDHPVAAPRWRGTRRVRAVPLGLVRVGAGEPD